PKFADLFTIRGAAPVESEPPGFVFTSAALIGVLAISVQAIAARASLLNILVDIFMLHVPTRRDAQPLRIGGIFS
ncbi:MAG TPA: hypothetical protein VK639_01995, partial [Terriglobales bacterium]|nr:hypothetical protein [Terriglobales bacterium]